MHTVPGRQSYGERGGGELRRRAEERLSPQAEVYAPALLRTTGGLGTRSGPPRVLREREEVPQRENSGTEAQFAFGDLLQHQQTRRRKAQTHDCALYPS